LLDIKRIPQRYRNFGKKSNGHYGNEKLNKSNKELIGSLSSRLGQMKTEYQS
jgi:hypothetical protein